jgi:serine protease Do
MGTARADGPPAAARPAGTGSILHQMNRAMVQIAEKVSPAVVQVQAVGFRSARQGSPAEAALVGRQHIIGSGVIVDPDGYILTNNHVVQGAQRVQVLVPQSGASAPAGEATARQLFDAKVIGAEPDVDLALLKIDARHLPSLSLEAENGVRQGEMVFALGSPEGLTRTVTMGIVGSAARQVDLAQPMVFVQTDAPINPGNSGGALVNVDGVLVGINTFILTESGGSQGLGFAIPAPMARLVYEGLRTKGFVPLVEVGIATQAITPVLAIALGLPRDWGVIVSDTSQGGAAKAAGVEVGDIIAAYDGHPIDSQAALTSARYLHKPGEPVSLALLRGNVRLSMSIVAPERAHPGNADMGGPEASLLRRLGILGVDVNERLEAMALRPKIASGVFVAARTLDATSVESGLRPGDIIHAMNRTAVLSLDGLRQCLRSVKAGDAVALQIEREGELAYLSFEME